MRLLGYNSLPFKSTDEVQGHSGLSIKFFLHCQSKNWEGKAKPVAKVIRWFCKVGEEAEREQGE